MSNKIYILSFLLLFVLTSTSQQSKPKPDRDTPAVLKALYIYNFATLTDWPSDYRKGEFVIGIYSQTDNVYAQLRKKYNGKSVGQQKINIVRFSPTSELKKVNILFLDRSRSGKIEEVISKIRNKSTLLVTNQNGYLSRGSVINFVEVDSRQSYEISVRNARRRKLVIASELERLAEKVIR